jgi:hypothetical protein
MPNSRWESFAMRVGHFLGLAYSVYQWLIAFGIGGFISSLVIGNSGLLVVVGLNLSMLSVGLGVFLWIRVSQQRLAGANPGFLSLRVEAVYTVLSNGAYKHKRTELIRARASGLDRYRHRYLWSGNGTVAIRSLKDDLLIEHGRDPRGIQNECVFIFPRPLAKGEEREVSYELELHDRDQSAKPYLGANVNVAKPVLILKVRFNDGGGQIRSAMRQIFLSHGASIPIWEASIPVDEGQSELYWKIRRARAGYRYQISWARA